MARVLRRLLRCFPHGPSLFHKCARCVWLLFGWCCVCFLPVSFCFVYCFMLLCSFPHLAASGVFVAIVCCCTPVCLSCFVLVCCCVFFPNVFLFCAFCLVLLCRCCLSAPCCDVLVCCCSWLLYVAVCFCLVLFCCVLSRVAMTF